MQLAALWCYFKYGRSIWNTDPVHVSICNTMQKHYGYYEAYDNSDRNSSTYALIRINPKLHRDLRSIVETVIHEYQHHLQPIESYERYFSLGYNYSDHPFETEASKIALRDAQECFEWVSKRLKKK
jgi:hypothetical protein